MNRYSIASVLVMAAIGYLVGWGHGHDRAEFDAKPIERLVYQPSPYASVCSDMLEAAWSVEDAMPLPAGLPHKP